MADSNVRASEQITANSVQSTSENSDCEIVEVVYWNNDHPGNQDDELCSIPEAEVVPIGASEDIYTEDLGDDLSLHTSNNLGGVDSTVPTPEIVFTVELKTYSTVGGKTKPMMVTILNVFSLTVKCGKCGFSFGMKALSEECVRSMESHTCTATAEQDQPIAIITPEQAVPRRHEQGNCSFDPEGTATRHHDAIIAPEQTASRHHYEDITIVVPGQTATHHRDQGFAVVETEQTATRHGDQDDAVVVPGQTDTRHHDDYNDQDVTSVISEETSNHLGQDIIIVVPNQTATHQQLATNTVPGQAWRRKAHKEVNQKRSHRNTRRRRDNIAELPEHTTDQRDKDFCVLCHYQLDHRCRKDMKKGQLEHKCQTKKRKCDLCDEIFTVKYILERHMSSVHGVKLYKCLTCGKDFQTKQSLQKHGVEKQFECPVCGKKFQEKRSLTNHMRLHTGERPFLCSVCGRGFIGHSSLQKHSCSNKEVFSCDVCGHKCRSSDKLRIHKLKSVKCRVPFLCTLCGCGFKNISGLRIHTSRSVKHKNNVALNRAKLRKKRGEPSQEMNLTKSKEKDLSGI